MLVVTPTPSADKGMYIIHEYHNLYLCWSFVLYAYYDLTIQVCNVT